MTIPTRSLDSNTLISVVIPCYNEEEVLEQLFERVQRAASKWSANYEVVMVDDGSTDSTPDMLRDLHARDARWKSIQLGRNFGHQTALWAGLQHARGDVVAVLDADLQDPPEVVDRFLEKWREGYDVVYAVRQKRKEGLLKRGAYALFYRVLERLSEIHIPLDSGDFCVVDRSVLDVLAPITEQEPFVRGLRAWVGFRQIGVPYERERRAGGEVKYTFRKLMQLALNGIFSFSTRPLRIATVLGLTVCMFAFVSIVAFALQRLFPGAFEAIGVPLVPGFWATIVAILFLGGVQLFCLGILGEYVARIYNNVKGRPQYTVRALTGIAPPRERPPHTNSNSSISVRANAAHDTLA
jgi:dolichol-phosphate mannosyltransferase